LLFARKFEVRHVPLINGHQDIFDRYSEVEFRGSFCPPSLLPGHKNYIGYDGSIVPITFQVFDFRCADLSIPGGVIVSEIKNQGACLATGYEVSLCGQSEAFAQLIAKRKEELITSEFANKGKKTPRKFDSFVGLTVNDHWLCEDGHYVTCVEIVGGKIVLRSFYAGNRPSGIREHSFPVGDPVHLVIAVEK
jgi:hypothetical protein